MPELRDIPIDRITEPQDPLRSHIPDEGIEELARSMTAVGLINPILVITRGNDYEIIAGHRRYLAARWLNWSTIAALVTTPRSRTFRSEAIIENIQREDINPDDEAQALQKLLVEHHLTPQGAAHRLGKSRGWVESRLHLLNLPEDLRQRVRESSLSLGAALALGEIPEPGWREYYTHHAIQDGATVQKVQAWVGQCKSDLARQRAAGLPEVAPSRLEPPPEPLYPCFGCRAPQPIGALTNQLICTDCLQHIADAGARAS